VHCSPQSETALYFVQLYFVCISYICLYLPIVQLKVEMGIAALFLVVCLAVDDCSSLAYLQCESIFVLNDLQCCYKLIFCEY